MHNLKDLRSNFDDFKKKIATRNIKIDLDEILLLDEKNRKLIQEKEFSDKENNDISKSHAKSLFKKSKELSLKIEKLSKDQGIVKKKIR